MYPKYLKRTSVKQKASFIQIVKESICRCTLRYWRNYLTIFTFFAYFFEITVYCQPSILSRIMNISDKTQNCWTKFSDTSTQMEFGHLHPNYPHVAKDASVIDQFRLDKQFLRLRPVVFKQRIFIIFYRFVRVNISSEFFRPSDVVWKRKKK